jgi:predicted transcriptional regulator
MSEQQPEISAKELTELAVEMVAAFVGHNAVQQTELSNLIASVHSALAQLGKPQRVAPEKPTPLMPIKKTVNPDFLVSLEDGRRYKSLKRHLAGRGLTPQQYREKWALPPDYPMVAPNYAKQRSELAKALGLGRKREAAVPMPQVKRGRRKAA